MRVHLEPHMLINSRVKASKVNVVVVEDLFV